MQAALLRLQLLPVRVLQNFRIEVLDHEEQEDNQRNGSCESQPVAPVFQLITGARLCVNVSLFIAVKLAVGHKKCCFRRQRHSKAAYYANLVQTARVAHR